MKLKEPTTGVVIDAADEVVDRLLANGFTKADEPKTEKPKAKKTKKTKE